MKIIFDADDVFYPTNQTAVDKLNREKGTNFKLNDVTSWGLLGNELDERLEYYKDPAFIRDLVPYPEAPGFVRKVAKMAEVFVATSVAPNCAGERVNSIIKYFPEIDPGNILIGSRKDMPQADVLLDDAEHNIQNARVTYPILFRKPWNRTTMGCLAVSSYGEFLTFLKMLERKRTDGRTLKPSVFALVGPSGSDKVKLAKALCDTGKFDYVKTYTTDPAKAHSSRYHYRSLADFEKIREEFFETSTYAGHEYGTIRKSIAEVLYREKNALLILDINGAIAMKRAFGDCCMNIFVQRQKSDCIRNILKDDICDREKTDRIVSLDAEFKNAEFCDIVVNKGISEDVKTIVEVAENGRL